MSSLQMYMKQWVVAFAFLFLPFNALGCFVQPEGLYEQQISEVNNILLVCVILLVLSAVLRLFVVPSRVWQPLFIASIYGYYPFSLYFWDRLGSSDFGGLCGIPGTVYAAKMLLYGMIAIFAYELIIFARHKYTSYRCKLTNT